MKKLLLLLSIFIIWKIDSNAQKIDEVIKLVSALSITNHGNGSGFMLKDSLGNFWLITAGHILKSKIKNGDILKFNYYNRGIPGTDSGAAFVYENLDILAIRMTQKMNYQTIEIYPFSPKLLQKVYYIGYPWQLNNMVNAMAPVYSIINNELQPTVTVGYLNAAVPYPNHYEIICSTPSAKGMSGGLACIEDSNGNIIPVGVISRVWPFQQQIMNKATKNYEDNYYVESPSGMTTFAALNFRRLLFELNERIIIGY